MFRNHLLCFKNICLLFQGTVIFNLSRNSVKQFLMKYRHLLLNHGAINTHLSLDHIKTGTGNEDSPAEHTKREINPLHNERENEAAILDHQVKSTWSHYVIRASADQNMLSEGHAWLRHTGKLPGEYLLLGLGRREGFSQIMNFGKKLELDFPNSTSQATRGRHSQNSFSQDPHPLPPFRNRSSPPTCAHLRIGSYAPHNWLKRGGNMGPVSRLLLPNISSAQTNTKCSGKQTG